MPEKARRGEAVKPEDLDEPKNRTLVLRFSSLSRRSQPPRTDETRTTLIVSLTVTQRPLTYSGSLRAAAKTEAYLGLTAYTLAIRRLQGEVEGRPGQYGVAVLMRYTLRLLTLQQFQRASTLICACETIRRGDPARWGDEPFRIGLWVGYRTTPNTTDDSAEALKQAHGQRPGGAMGTPAQLKHCPWCGSVIEPGRDIEVRSFKKASGRTLLYLRRQARALSLLASSGQRRRHSGCCRRRGDLPAPSVLGYRDGRQVRSDALEGCRPRPLWRGDRAMRTTRLPVS